MKKLLTVAVLASAAAAYAVDTAVVGTVGVTKVTTGAKNTIIVTSYSELGTGETMAVSNVVKTATLPAKTKLYVLNGGTAYEGYTLTGGKWERDVNYAVTAQGIGDSSESTGTDVPTLNVGKGFWLSLPDGESTTQTVVIYGQPPAVTNLAITTAGTYLVGNPTQGNKAPTIQTPAHGDSILFFEDGATFPTVYKSNGTAWKCGRNTSASLPTVTAGTGFWYIAKGTSAVIKW